jgi:hypothetical protein
MAPGEAAETMSGLFSDQARFRIYFRGASNRENPVVFQRIKR